MSEATVCGSRPGASKGTPRHLPGPPSASDPGKQRQAGGIRCSLQLRPDGIPPRVVWKPSLRSQMPLLFGKPSLSPGAAPPSALATSYRMYCVEKTPLRGTQLPRGQLLGVRGWLCSEVISVAASARLCTHSAFAAFCPMLKWVGGFLV